MSEMPSITRILVALDASPLSLAALEAAAALVQRTGGALTGVFVEDVNLTRLAGHPAATSLSLVGGLRRDPGHRLLDHALRLQLATARRAFEDVAERLGQESRFDLRQGRVEAELRAAAEQADLVLVGCSGQVDLPSPPLRLGATTRALVERAPRPVLVVRALVPAAQPVAVLYDGSAAARRAAVLAARLAAASGARLEVIVPITDAETMQAREDEARRLTSPHAITAESVAVPSAASRQLAAEASRHPMSVLVLPDTARHLLEVLPCSVVVVP